MSNKTIDNDDILDFIEANKYKRKLRSENYFEFINKIHSTLNIIFKGLQDSANHQVQREDLLTIQIVNQLKWSFQNTINDQNRKGHVDITITEGDFIWLAEAKIFRDYTNLFKGICQLITRYSLIESEKKINALIIYFFKDKVKTRMKIWKNQLDVRTQKEPYKTGIGLQGITCEIDENLTFISHHKTRDTEFNHCVYHFPVLLYHNPLDRHL